jgi:hypothetical protein
MLEPIEAQAYQSVLLDLLDETFDQHHGIYLDKGTGLFRTLEQVSAEEASIPVGGKCASLAAQVAHVIFYIESFERYALYNDTSPRDWGEIWRTVEKVSVGEWDALRGKLREAYNRMDKMFRTNELWNEDTMGGSLSIVIHTAYHLGEIRQALCTLKK